MKDPYSFRRLQEINAATGFRKLVLLTRKDKDWYLVWAHREKIRRYMEATCH